MMKTFTAYSETHGIYRTNNPLTFYNHLCSVRQNRNIQNRQKDGLNSESV